MLEKEQRPPNNSKFEWNGDIVSGERRYFETFIRSLEQFLN